MAKKKAKKKATTTKKKAGKKASSAEVLVVGSKVKSAIRDRGFRTSGDALEGLNGWIHWLIGQATDRAKANGRQTVRGHDFLAM